jgi:antirestriction protein ArdC
MPEFADFHTSDDYYSTLAHELCHATGHVDRLARPSLISTKREDYAREELVAELGAAFVSATIGIKLHDREDTPPIWRVGYRPAQRQAVHLHRRPPSQDASDWLLSRMAVETAPELDEPA